MIYLPLTTVSCCKKTDLLSTNFSLSSTISDNSVKPSSEYPLILKIERGVRGQGSVSFNDSENC
jgi:hypothetical protein